MHRSRQIIMRYLWSALLLLAAIISPDLSSSITLAIAAFAYAAFVATREQRLSRIMGALTDALAPANKPTAPQKQITSTSLERSLTHLQKRLLLTAAATELVIFVVTILAGSDAVTARNYAVLVLVAVAPLGLEAEIAVLLHTRSPETVRTAMDYATEDSLTLLSIIGLSFIGTIWLHIPPALSVVEILIITCIARPLLSGRALQITPHKADQPWRTLFAAATVYISFLFFFLRHYFSPTYLDPHNPITWRATSVALATFVACQAALLLINPKAPKNAVYKGGALLAVLLVVVYLPLTHTYLMTHAITAIDWFCVIIAALFYVSLCLLQSFSSTHSRKAVVALHKVTK